MTTESGSRRAPWTAVPPAALVLTGIISVQFGAGLAARLFSQIAPAAVTGLRLWTSAAVMAVIGARPLPARVRPGRRRPAGATPGTPVGEGPVRGAWPAWRDAAVVAGFGVTLAVMNYSIYQSFARIPLGISVTVEFLGPLGVAVASSRRLLDVLWVGLAGTGVALLARRRRHRGHRARRRRRRDRVRAAGRASWAAYILLSRATGQRFPGSTGLAIAMLVSAVVITPVGSRGGRAGPAAARRPGRPAWASGCCPRSSRTRWNWRRCAGSRPRVFGIWMSLEPAVAALVGLLLLGQALAGREWLAIGCVMIACAGAARGAREPAAPEA